MDNFFYIDPKVLRRLETGTILKHDLLYVKNHLKRVYNTLKLHYSHENSNNEQYTPCTTSGYSKSDLETYVHTLVNYLNKSLLNLDSISLIRLLKSLLDQLVKVLHVSKVLEFEGAECTSNFVILYLLCELDRCSITFNDNHKPALVSLIRDLVNEKISNYYILFLFESLLKRLNSDDYANFMDDIVRKLKRNSSNVLQVLDVLFRSVEIGVIGNLYDVLVLLCSYPFDRLIVEMLEVLSVSINVNRCSSSDNQLSDLVDRLLGYVTTSTNRDETERLSSILSYIIYSPYYVSSRGLSLYNKFLSFSDDGLVSSRDEVPKGSQSIREDWKRVVDRHISTIDRNCNNKLFSKAQINFVKFTTSLYLLSLDDRLLSILVKLFNSIVSVGDSHVNYVLQSVIMVFYDPLTSSLADSNSINGGVGKLDTKVVTKIYNNVVDKCIYKLTLIQALYLGLKLNVDVKLVSKLDNDGSDLYYTLLEFHYYYHLLTSAGGRLGLVKSDSGVDLESFIEMYVSGASCDELQVYYSLLQSYKRLTYFSVRVISPVDDLMTSLAVDHIVNIFLVVIIKRLYNKRLLFHLYKLFSDRITADVNLRLLYAFVFSSPGMDKYDYIQLKLKFPKIISPIDPLFFNKNRGDGSIVSSDGDWGMLVSLKKLTMKLYNHNLNMSFLLSFGKKIDFVLPLLLSSLLENYKRYIGVNISSVGCSSVLVNSVMENILTVTSGDDEVDSLYNVYENVQMIENEAKILKNKNVTRSELDGIKMHRSYLVYKQRLEILNQVVNVYNVLYNVFYGRLKKGFNDSISSGNFRLLFYVLLKFNSIKLFRHFNRILLKMMLDVVFNKSTSVEMVGYIYSGSSVSIGSPERRLTKSGRKVVNEGIDGISLLQLLCVNVNSNYLVECFTVMNYAIRGLVVSNSERLASSLDVSGDYRVQELEKIYDSLLLMLENRYAFDVNVFKYVYYLHINGKDCEELLNRLGYLIDGDNLVYLFHLYFLTNMKVILELLTAKSRDYLSGNELKFKNRSSRRGQEDNEVGEVDSSLEEFEKEMVETEMFEKEFGIIKKIKLSSYLGLFEANGVSGVGDSHESCENDIIELFKLYMIDLPASTNRELAHSDKSLSHAADSSFSNRGLEVFKNYYCKHYDIMGFLEFFSGYLDKFSDKAQFYDLLSSLLATMLVDTEDRKSVLLYLVDKYCYVDYYHMLLGSIRIVVDGMEVGKLGDRVVGLIEDLTSRYLGLSSFLLGETEEDEDQQLGAPGRSTDRLMVLLITAGILNIKLHQSTSMDGSHHLKELSQSVSWTIENLLKTIPFNADLTLIEEAKQTLLTLFGLTKMSTNYVTDQLNLYYEYAMAESRYTCVFLVLLSVADGVSRTSSFASSATRGSGRDAYRHHFVNKLVAVNGGVSHHSYEQYLESLMGSLGTGTISRSDSAGDGTVSAADAASIVLLESIVVEYGNELSNLYELLFIMSNNVIYINSLQKILRSLLSVNGGSVGDGDCGREKLERLAVSNFNAFFNIVVNNLMPATTSTVCNSSKLAAKINKNLLLYYNLYLLNFLVVNFSQLLLENNLLRVLDVVNEYVININSKLKNLTVSIINSFVRLLGDGSVFNEHRSSLISALTVPNDQNLVALVERTSESCEKGLLVSENSANDSPREGFGAVGTVKMDITLLNYMITKCIKMSRLKLKLVQISAHLLRSTRCLETLRYYVHNVVYLLLHLIYDPIQDVHSSVLELVRLFSLQYTLIITRDGIGSDADNKIGSGGASPLASSVFSLSGSGSFTGSFESSDLIYVLFGKLNHELIYGERFVSFSNKGLSGGKQLVAVNQQPVEADEQLLVCHLISNLLMHLSDDYKFHIVNGYYQYIYQFANTSGSYSSSSSGLTNSGGNTGDTELDRSLCMKELVAYISMFVYLPYSCYQIINVNVNSILALFIRLFSCSEFNTILAHVFTSLVLINNGYIVTPDSSVIGANCAHNSASSDLINSTNDSGRIKERVNRLIVYYLLYALYPFSPGANSGFVSAYSGSIDSLDGVNSYDSSLNGDANTDPASVTNIGLSPENKSALKLTLLKLIYLFINPQFVLNSDYPLNHMFQSSAATVGVELDDRQKLIWSYIYLNKFDLDDSVNVNITRFIKLHNIQYILNTIVGVLIGVIFDNLFYNSVENKLIANRCLKFMLDRYCSYSSSVLDKLLSPPIDGLDYENADGGNGESVDSVNGYGGSAVTDGYKVNGVTTVGDEYGIFYIKKYVESSSPSCQLVQACEMSSDSLDSVDYSGNTQSKSTLFTTSKAVYIPHTSCQPSGRTRIVSTSTDSILVGSCLGIHTYYTTTNDLLKLKHSDQSLESHQDFLIDPRRKLDQVVVFLTKCLRYHKCCKYALESLSLISNHYSNVLVATIIPSFLSVFHWSPKDQVDSEALFYSKEDDAVRSVYYLVSYNNDYFEYIFDQLVDTYHSNLSKGLANGGLGDKTSLRKNDMILDLLLKLCNINGGQLILDNNQAFFQLLSILNRVCFGTNVSSVTSSCTNEVGVNRNGGITSGIGIKGLSSSSANFDNSDLLDRFVQSIDNDNIYKLIYLLIKEVLALFSNGSSADIGEEDPVDLYFVILYKLLDNKMIITNFLQEYLTFILHLTTSISGSSHSGSSIGFPDGCNLEQVETYVNMLFNKLVSINTNKLATVIDTIHDHLSTNCFANDADSFRVGNDSNITSCRNVWTSTIDLCIGYLNNNSSNSLIKAPIEVLLTLSEHNVENFNGSCLKLFGILIRLINVSSGGVAIAGASSFSGAQISTGNQGATNKSRENRLNMMKLLKNLLSIDTKHYHQITSQLMLTIVKTTFESNLSKVSADSILKLLVQLPSRTSNTLSQLFLNGKREVEDKRVVTANVLNLSLNVLDHRSLRNEVFLVENELLLSYLINSNNELALQIVGKIISLLSDTNSDCNASDKKTLFNTLLDLLDAKLNSLNELDIKILIQFLDPDLLFNSKFNHFISQLSDSNTVANRSFYFQIVAHTVSNIQITDQSTFDLIFSLVQLVNVTNERHTGQFIKTCNILEKSQYISDDQREELNELIALINSNG